jgi:hypothetical protein
MTLLRRSGRHTIVDDATIEVDKDSVFNATRRKVALNLDSPDIKNSSNPLCHYYTTYFCKVE